MVNIAQIEGQMRASSLRRIGELVEKHPDETLSIVRGWMVQEGGSGAYSAVGNIGDTRCLEE